MMQRFGILKVKHLRRRAGAPKIAVLMAAGLLAPAAWAQAPLNDSFANAQELKGDFGTVTADTTAATTEAGEQSHAGLTPRHTIWYKWTASTDGPVEFDTFNSSFDTVLAVYVGNALANLSQVVANDDINTYNPENPSRPGNDPYLKNPYLGPSGVKFNATRGQLYYIVVGGTKKNDAQPGYGTAVLSWAYHPSGVFRLSHQFYECTEAESEDPANGSVGPSARGARITINRLFGSSGKAIVSFTLIDASATLGIDYKWPATNTVVFDDYETSKSFVVPVIDDSIFGIHYCLNPGRIGGQRVGDVPFLPSARHFEVALTNVVLDGLEDPTVLSPPRLENRFSSATTYIYDLETPAFGWFDPASPTLGVTNGVAAFERRYFRVSKKVGVANILVYRSIQGKADQGTEIHYHISTTWHPPETEYNEFDLAAGSDYAHPVIEYPANTKRDLYPDYGTTNAPGRLALDHGDCMATDTDGSTPFPSDPPVTTASEFGTLRWDSFDFSAKAIQIPIIDNGQPGFNKDLWIRLYRLQGHTQDAELNDNNIANVTILYDEYPPGALDDTHNPDWDISTEPANNAVPGTDAQVYSLAVHPNDNKTVIVGNFSTYNAAPRYGVARINMDGSLDTLFNPGDGVPVKDPINPAFVTSLAFAPSDKIVIGGSFPSYNGTPRYNVARLNSDGSLDTAFNPGLGANNAVWSVAVQTNGQVLIGGEFTTVNGYPRSHIARLNSDGSLDTFFDPGPDGPDGTVYAIALTPDGSMYIGGDFLHVNGLFRSSIARISTNGVVVPAFSPVTGCDGPVYSLALQLDGKLLVGGAFANVEFRSRNNITRYNPDGSLDALFDPGSGTDDSVYSIALQPDGRIILGGVFTVYNQTRRIALARLFPTGELDTGFMDTAYNQFAGPHKTYYNPYIDPKDFLYTLGLQSDGNLMVGGRFHYFGGGRFNVNVATNSYAPADPVSFTRVAYRSRWNVTRVLGGDINGPGGISLITTNYNVGENAGFFYVKEVRQNGWLGQIESTFLIPPRQGSNTIGVAQSGVDYIYNRVNPHWGTSWPGTRKMSHGLFGTNNVSIDPLGNSHTSGLEDIYVTIMNLPGYQGDRSLPFKLDMPSYADQFWLGGENIPLASARARSTGFLNIQEDDRRPGVIGFASSSFSVNENGTNAVITIIRTNGSSGVVAFTFATTNGTAVAGVNYTGVTNTITLRDGQTSTNVTIPINNDFTIEQADRTIYLYLANPGNGATLGSLSNAVLYVVDDDFLPGRINFTTTSYTTNEDAGDLVLTVTRAGGNVGIVDVQYASSNLTAVAGVNYMPVSGTLHWDDGDTTPRSIVVQLIHDLFVTPNRQFTVTLFNPSIPGALGSRTVETNTIVNVDFYGTLQFSAASYNVSERGGYATITVTRTGGSAETVSASFRTADSTAYQFFNYLPTNGSLVFGPGEASKSFTVPVLDDGVQDPAFFGFNVLLSNFSPTSSSGNPAVAFVKIIDASTFNEPPGQVDTYFNPNLFFNGDVYSVALQPDASILTAGNFTIVSGQPANRIVRLTPDGYVDTTFLTLLLPGANDAVRSVISQTDTRIVLGGAFTAMNGVARKGVARLNFDGSLDTGFNPGSGADGIVYALAETFDFTGPRKVLVGGAFVSFNGVASPGIIRLNDDATVDTSFDTGIGVNGTVYAVAVYPTNTIFAGKTIIGGDFTAVNGVTRPHIARLNVDGSLDTSFEPGTGADNTVRALAIEPNGSVVLGGFFTNVNGVALNRIARLRGDGSVDPAFQPGAGANDVVYAVTLQPDNRILLGGGFTIANDASRGRLTRLMPDGQVDPTINFGTGANDYVGTIAVRPDGKLIIGGGFTQVQDLPRLHLARLYGGSVIGSGSFRFSSPVYQVDEDATNVLIKVVRDDGTMGPNPDGSGNITVSFATTDGTALAGRNYTTVITNLVFPPGETVRTVSVPVIDDQQITPDLNAFLSLANPTPPATLGTQPGAMLTIFNVESSISFSSQTYQRAENAVDGVATITFARVGSTRHDASVRFSTVPNGNAVPNVNYTPVTNALVTFFAGHSNAFYNVPIFHTPVAEGDTTVGLRISDPLSAFLVAPTEATLTIVDVDSAPGTFVFSQTNYVVGEGDGFALITVVRTNGHSGDSSVTMMTLPGDATPGLKYVPTNYAIPFANGEVVKSFAVQILEENQVEGNQSLYLLLTNATGGTAIGSPNPVPLTIIDDDVGLSFATNSALNAVYIVSETNSSLIVDVFRLNAPTGLVTTVSYYTTNGTALAGRDYVPASGTLTFNPGESQKSLSLTILRNPEVTGDLTFAVKLANPTPGVQIAPPTTANVVINDVDTGLSLLSTNTTPTTNATYWVMKNGTNVLITVIRTNANTGPVSVTYATADGTAVAPIDYVAVSGTLFFTNGQLSSSFTVPIMDDNLVKGDRYFTVSLLNPTPPAQLLSPSFGTVNIIDNETGFHFSSGSYQVAENGVAALINVQRIGYTNGTASVAFATQNGTAKPGIDYTPTNGVLVFNNGELSKSFAVGVIDNTILDGDRTVLVSLSNPQGSATLVNPSAATLTIHDNDGSLIIPAGAALISESFTPANTVIEPGETVSMLFAFRNSAGTNTVNLTATLLATNGITAPSAPQSYGVLVAQGPSASQPFTFTASGTNGQRIVATFQLTDLGHPVSTNAGIAAFTFTLGTSTASASNPALITINDIAPATPYPATINAQGIDGVISKVTVRLNNYGHGSPSDVDALVVSPDYIASLIMGHAGSGTVSRATLTFDDAAAAMLGRTAPVISGTYKPSVYYPLPAFPVPAPPAYGGQYTNSLTVFNGSNPNGLWSLYVMDDTYWDSGAISNGWALNFTLVNPVIAATDVGITMTGTPDSIVLTSNVTYTINAVNYGPGAATGVTITNLFPAGSIFVSADSSVGSFATNGAGALIWNVGTMPKDSTASLSLTVLPTTIGAITNSAAVGTTSPDLNPDDNAAAVVTTVIGQTADLALTMLSQPEPALLGQDLTYTIQIANLGPGSAESVGLVDRLPAGVALVSADPPVWELNGTSLNFTNLGTVGLGDQAVVSIVVRPLTAGTFTNIATCASPTPDPYKLNNSAAVKSLVEGLSIQFQRIGNSLTLAWPAGAGNLVLESAPDLLSTNWVPVTEGISIINGQQVAIIPIGPGNMFFRLRSP